MSADANQREPSVREVLGIGERAKVLLLGTYHFAFQNRDQFNYEEKVDILSPHKQAEVAEVTRLLAEFQPTKVAVEKRWDQRAEVEQQYQAYRAGDFELPASEVYQLGFRLAARCGHEQVYPIDDWGRLYDPWAEVLDAARRQLGLDATATDDEVWTRMVGAAWLERFGHLVQHMNRQLVRQTLREHLLFHNSREFLAWNHGGYLVWENGEPGDYALVDHITGWWYNRNLRIFANLKRIPTTPEDRILVIYGSGHAPLLRHAIETSWEYELVEPATYLAP